MSGETSTTDPYHEAVDVGQLMRRVRELETLARKSASDVVEAHAYAVACPRHLPHMRCCAWQHNKPCSCRATVAARWPEYAEVALMATPRRDE